MSKRVWCRECDTSIAAPGWRAHTYSAKHREGRGREARPVLAATYGTQLAAALVEAANQGDVDGGVVYRDRHIRLSDALAVVDRILG